MVERLVTFQVLGQEYPLYTDAPEEDVQEILALVKSHLEYAGQVSSQVLPANKLGILTSLNIASSYVKMRKEYGEYRQLIEGKIASLSEKIEESL